MAKTNIDSPKKVASSFLKTMCILTFIGVSIANFIGPIYSHINLDKNILILEKKIDELKSVDENSIAVTSLEDALDETYRAKQNKNTTLILNLLAGAFCIFGATLMLFLNKNGFFFYTIGELAPVISHFIMFGFGNTKFSMFTSAFSIIIPLAFIIIYAVQLKDME
ncbi:MAG: hypothetical protein RL065_378 [Bacteroidota bacterium]